MTYMRIEMHLPDEGRLELPAVDALASLARLGKRCMVNYAAHDRDGEPMRVVTTFCEDTPDTRMQVESIARAYLEDTQEEAVLYVINTNEVNLIITEY